MKIATNNKRSTTLSTGYGNKITVEADATKFPGVKTDKHTKLNWKRK
jgi:hypothetical protein